MLSCNYRITSQRRRAEMRTTMTRQFILAHDLGTTGNKASLYDREGKVLASSFYGYGLELPQVNWVEQNPEDWWQAVCVSTQQLLATASVQPSRNRLHRLQRPDDGLRRRGPPGAAPAQRPDLGRHAGRGGGPSPHRQRRHGTGLPDHRPPGQFLLFRRQDPVGAQPPARAFPPGAQVLACQRLHRRPPDRQLRHRLLGRLRDEPLRSPGGRLVGADPGRHRAGSGTAAGVACRPAMSWAR